MTKKELIEILWNIPGGGTDTLADFLILHKVVTVDPEPEPFECWVNVYEKRTGFHSILGFESIIGARVSSENNPTTLLRTAIHMREVTGKDYQKMWEELREWLESNSTLADDGSFEIVHYNMEKIEKENE